MQSPSKRNSATESVDRTKTSRNWSVDELQRFMLAHFESVHSSLSPQSKALRVEQFAELSGEHECLRIDIECIERRLETLETTMRTLGEYMGSRKTGRKFMEEKMQKHREEYGKKQALLQEKYREKHALLSSIFAVGQF